MGRRQGLGRRGFLAAVVAGLAAPLVAEAQPTERVRRVGVLTGQAPQSPMWEPLVAALRELGYTEGKNVAFVWQSSGGRAERLDRLAEELVRVGVDVIVASDNPAVAAARKASRTVPIVMVLAQDPVSSGFVSSLARPGGNVTGLSAQAPEQQGKLLQLLKEAVPTVSRVAVLWDATEPGRREIARETQAAGARLKLDVPLREARAASDLERLFMEMARDRVNAVVVHGSQMMQAQRAKVASLAVQTRLPTMSAASWYPEAGGLMSYGLSYRAQFRRAADYVDRLLKGATPADLPVEQPTKFELIINRRTAKALGVTIPPALLQRADQVIE